MSRPELDALRTIERVERGRVIGVGNHRIGMDTGEVVTTPNELHVDCTAAGVPLKARRPVFEPRRLTMQHISVGSAPLSAATIGAVEALPDDDAEKNRLCPPHAFSGRVADLLQLAHIGLVGAAARSARQEIASWHDRCRLNPTAAARDHREEPEVVAARAIVASNFVPALQRRLPSGEVSSR